MNRPDFNQLTEDTFDRIRKLNGTKGIEYSGHDDVLSDFKEVAAQLGVDPRVALMTYATKHWRAINSYCREGRVLSESIIGRIDDLILYSILLQAMIADDYHPSILSTTEHVPEESPPDTDALFKSILDDWLSSPHRILLRALREARG